MASVQDDDSSDEAKTSFSVPSPSSSEATAVGRRHVGSWMNVSTQEAPQLKSANLLCRNDLERHVWDLDFLWDGRIIAITGSEVKMEGKIATVLGKELRMLNESFDKYMDHFPMTLADPGGVAVCRSTGSVAITHRSTSESESGGMVTILKNENNNWTHYASYKTNNMAFRLGLTNTDVPVCAVRWEKLIKYTSGKRTWTRSISSCNDLVPYVAVEDNANRIVVSTPINNRVSTFSKSGEIITVFPCWGLKRPAGICLDSFGRVYVADRASQTVLQYTVQGQYIQTIVHLSVEPRCVAVLHDKYLAVGTLFSGIYLYRLIWM